MASLQMMTHPMALPVIFPLLAGLVCLLIPNIAAKLRALLAVLATVAVLAMVWPLFQQTGAVWDPVPWLSLKVDVLSAFILLAVAFLKFQLGQHRHKYTNYRRLPIFLD